jgi:hypothetical protein
MPEGLDFMEDAMTLMPFREYPAEHTNGTSLETSKPKVNTKAARRKIRNVRRGGRDLEMKPSREMDDLVGKLGHKPSQTLLGKDT